MLGAHVVRLVQRDVKYIAVTEAPSNRSCSCVDFSSSTLAPAGSRWQPSLSPFASQRRLSIHRVPFPPPTSHTVHARPPAPWSEATSAGRAAALPAPSPTSHRMLVASRPSIYCKLSHTHSLTVRPVPRRPAAPC